MSFFLTYSGSHLIDLESIFCFSKTKYNCASDSVNYKDDQTSAYYAAIADATGFDFWEIKLWIENKICPNRLEGWDLKLDESRSTDIKKIYVIKYAVYQSLGGHLVYLSEREAEVSWHDKKNAGSKGIMAAHYHAGLGGGTHYYYMSSEDYQQAKKGKGLECEVYS